MTAEETTAPATDAPAAPPEPPEPTTPPATGEPEIKDPAAVLAALNKANKEAETLRLKVKEFEDRDKTESQKQADALDAATRDRDDAVAKAARLEVIATKGVPPEWQFAIPKTGTPDEMGQAADAVLTQIAAAGKPRPPAPVPTQGATGAVSPADADKWLRDAARH